MMTLLPKSIKIKYEVSRVASFVNTSVIGLKKYNPMIRSLSTNSTHMNVYGFFKQFVRNPKNTGAILASGSKLSELLVRSAGVACACTIIEFGTGTGVVTEEIIRRKSKTANFIGIEINTKFAEATRRRCPQAEVVTANAMDAKEILLKQGLSSCDCIVSGLPWAIFSEDIQDNLLNTAIEILCPGGTFVTFAYLQGLPFPSGRRFRLKLEEKFATVDTTTIVWANMPPAIVYVANKAKYPKMSS